MNISCLDADYYQVSGFQFELLRPTTVVVFDLEATGVDWGTERITQIGPVVLNGRTREVQDSFMRHVNPERPIPPRIQELTGITDADVRCAPEFAEAFKLFTHFCGDAPLVTQAGFEFDFPILRAECERFGLHDLSNARIDTKVLYTWLHPECPSIPSTDFISDAYGIDRSPYKRHDALGDAHLISRMFCSILEEAANRGVTRIGDNGPLRVRRSRTPPIRDVTYHVDQSRAADANKARS